MVGQEFLSSSKKWDWETPVWLIDKLKTGGFNLVLDVAATAESTKCDRFITPEMDAFKTDWQVEEGELWWLNPPWGRAYKKETGIEMMDWMRRAVDQFVFHGYEGVAIVSARVDTRWWHYTVVMGLPYVCCPLGRVHFIDPETGKPATQPTFPSALLIFMDKLTPRQEDTLMDIGWLVHTVSARAVLAETKLKGVGFRGHGIPVDI